ncbi:MAG: ferrous iron transport protein B, partial [Planctomycetes bacterium]|nr:ferrous iron transport protein B [Planctomycetota bacterium]
YKIDHEALSKLLGVPIVPAVATQGKGMDELLEAALAVAADSTPDASRVKYGREIEEELAEIAALIAVEGPLAAHLSPRWTALKLLEADEPVRSKVEELARDPQAILDAVEKSTKHLSGIFGEDPEMVIADRRYGFISGACQECVRSTVESRHETSDRIDSVVTNRLLGIPIFVGLMWVVFSLTFYLGAPLMGWIEDLFGWFGGTVAAVLPEGYLQSLIVDGIIGGVGGVLVFLPNILLLFLALAVLEDSGYMARAAFILDRLMHKIGLHGRSFIPMLIGFGCNVPAIMATRTIESRNDRLTTIMVNPLVSCSARLPVYVLLAGAFFTRETAGNLIFGIYFLGIVLAVIMAKVFRKFLLRGESTPFVMELPPYRMPTLKSVIIHMWERGRLYVRKAGTIILGFSILMWFLSTFPALPENLQKDYDARIEAAAGEEEVAAIENEMTEKALEASYAGHIGRGVAVFLKPVGLGDWKIGTALFAGFGAKEVVVSTMGTLYSLGETDEESSDLRNALQKDSFFTPLVAVVMMVFVLIYVPCMATVAVVKRETNSWRWPLFLIAYTTGLAWVVSGIVYWGGTALGYGG